MTKGLYDVFKHWFHGGQIYFYSDPHFSDKEMNNFRNITDEKQIQLINSKVGKCDTIVILGDIGNKELLKKIRGYKVLVLGNHDAGATTYEGYADEIYSGALMISDKILLTHEPVNFQFAMNIHGHNHSTAKNDAMHLNVCAEHINYLPVGLNDLVKKGLFRDVPNIHRYTIDKIK